MEETVAPDLARLWRLSTTSRLGRPAELDVDVVVHTAVAIADRDGLAGATLPKIAKELGFTPMSLYRHVGSKDELLELMRDAASETPPERATGDWRDGLRQWAAALRATCERHPWLAELPVSGPPRGPNAIAWMDAFLRVVRDTGLGWGAKVGVLGLLSGYVRTATQLANELAAGRHDTGLDQAQVEQDYGRTLAMLVDPARFPEAAQLFTSDAFEPAPPTDPADHDFTFGLELILDGIAAAIDNA